MQQLNAIENFENPRQQYYYNCINAEDEYYEQIKKEEDEINQRQREQQELEN